MKYSAYNWQDFSQKKDIEQIIKLLKGLKSTFIVVLVEIAYVIIGVVFNRIYENISPDLKTIYFIILIGISLFPALFYLCKEMYKKIMKHFYPIASMSHIEMIDSFDNEICYYILMADSFGELFTNSKSTISDGLVKYYLLEMVFYKNKAIDRLNRFHNYQEIFENDFIERTMQSRCKKISLVRLNLMFTLLDEISVIISNAGSQVGDEAIRKYITAEETKYQSIFDDVKGKIRSTFGLTLEQIK
jgi:hypothetical protein